MKKGAKKKGNVLSSNKNKYTASAILVILCICISLFALDNAGIITGNGIGVGSGGGSGDGSESTTGGLFFTCVDHDGTDPASGTNRNSDPSYMIPSYAHAEGNIFGILREDGYDRVDIRQGGVDLVEAYCKPNGRVGFKGTRGSEGFISCGEYYQTVAPQNLKSLYPALGEFAPDTEASACCIVNCTDKQCGESSGCFSSNLDVKCYNLDNICPTKQVCSPDERKCVPISNYPELCSCEDKKCGEVDNCGNVCNTPCENQEDICIKGTCYPLPEPEEGLGGLAVIAFDSESSNQIRSSVQLAGPIDLPSSQRDVITDDSTPSAPAEFLSLQPGKSYKITVSNDDYQSYTNFVYVEPDKTGLVQVELNPLPETATVYIWENVGTNNNRPLIDKIDGGDTDDCRISYYISSTNKRLVSCTFYDITSTIGQTVTFRVYSTSQYVDPQELYISGPLKKGDGFETPRSICFTRTGTVGNTGTFSYCSPPLDDWFPGAAKEAGDLNATAAASGTFVSLSWNSVSGAEIYNYSRYTYEGILSAGPESRNATLPTVISGSGVPTGSYYFRVEAIDSAGKVISVDETELISVVR